MAKFVKYFSDGVEFPKRELISAVFLIALDGSRILVTRNTRGWDIPGGHVEEGETPEEALIREFQEEVGATFSNAVAFAYVGSDEEGRYKDKVTLMFATTGFKLGDFQPCEDAFEREVMEVDDFVEKSIHP